MRQLESTDSDCRFESHMSNYSRCIISNHLDYFMRYEHVPFVPQAVRHKKSHDFIEYNHSKIFTVF